MNTAVSYLPTAAGQATEAEIRRVFESQRETALRLRTSSAAERIAKIKRLREAVLAYSQDIIDAGFSDFKKPPAEVELSEILPIIAEANDAIRHIGKWMRPTSVWPTRMMMGTQSWVQYQPKGRTLVVSPWNYPVNLSFGPMISAIAAGNTVILKPSEMTPHAAAVMSKIVKEIFPENEVAVFEGDAAVSTALLSLPFDHIFFTGSPAIGKVVMTAAAKHLTSVTLELGGKSPTIVDETADLDLAAKTVLWGKFSNAGQTCIAPDYVYVHQSVKDQFLAKCVEVLKSSYGATPQEQAKSNSLARIVNQRHTGRINNLLQDAKNRGARVICGDLVNEQECFIAPTLLDNIPADAKIMSEEIFGPLLPIVAFNDLDQTIAAINREQKPLALYMWSRSEKNIQNVMNNTSSGGACINHCLVHFLHMNLPFGGVNNSGIGNGHGIYGFKTFSHERAVVRTRFMLARMFWAPYTDWTRRLIKLVMKTSI